MSGIGLLLAFDFGSELPDEGTKFTSDGNFDFVVVDLARGEGFVSSVEADLGFPREFSYPACLFFLSFGERGADFGGGSVVGGLFDEEPTSMGVSAFGDGALSSFAPAGVFPGDESEEGHEFFGVFEAAEGSDFGNGDHGGDELEAFEGHEGLDEGFALPLVEE